MKTTFITALSTICADIFENNGEIRLGGEALNFVMNIYKEPYISVSLLGAVGDDKIGKIVSECLSGTSIETSCVHTINGGKSASHIISLTPDGDRYFKPDAWDGGVFQSYRLNNADKEKICNSDIVFMNYSSPNADEVLELKKSNKFKLAIDFDIIRNFAEIEDAIKLTDFFFLSGEEKILPEICGLSERYSGIFNVTLAADGSVTYINGKEYRVKAVPVDKVVDTTGCGDSYHAGFIASYAVDGDIIRAMNNGSRMAAEVLSHLGGFA